MRHLTERLIAGGLVAVASAISLGLHAVVVVGLSDQRGRTMRVDDSIILDECMMGCRPPEFARLIAWGDADVRCRSDGRGRLSNCRWIRESGAGWGDAAVERVRDEPAYFRSYALRPGEITLRVLVCMNGCPVT